MSHEPRTLQEAIVYFAKPGVALTTMVELRWPNGVHCPTCGRTDVRFLETRQLWECKEKHAKKQFSAKLGTIMEDSPLSLDKWFAAIWMVANCKNGISSYKMARDLGITQKSAWFLDHRIRLAMKAGSIMKMSGEVEADETFIGGLAKNMHEKKKKHLGTGGAGKAVAMGIIERKSGEKASRVVVQHVSDVRAKTLQPIVRENVESGTILNTDAWKSYRGLSGDYAHQIVDHAVEYVRGTVHTNGIENFWSLLKRTIKGTYISVEPFHLGRYLDEQAFRFNMRKDDDAGRFRKVLSSIFGRRITYRELIGNGATPTPA